jgi:hypothetical protein
MTEKIQNAKQMPGVFYCKHMYAGLAGYENETILVDLPAMLALAKTMEAIPVYVLHQDVDMETVGDADGYVSDCWYNQDDGWLWAKFICKTDAAHDAIRDGWSVSNAYIPTDGGAGGTYTNINYDRKISGGQFTHLAIVPDPRYETACIMSPDQYREYMRGLENQKKQLSNSKQEKKPMRMRLFTNKKTEVTGIDDLAGTTIELRNGKSVSFDALLNNMDDYGELTASLENGSYEVEVDNEKMPLTDLVNRYSEMAKENAAYKDEEKKNMAEEEEEKENMAEEEKENMAKKNMAKEEDEKKNAKAFGELKNASNVKQNQAGYIGREERLAAGKKSY